MGKTIEKAWVEYCTEEKTCEEEQMLQELYEKYLELCKKLTGEQIDLFDEYAQFEKDYYLKKEIKAFYEGFRKGCLVTEEKKV